MPTFRSQSAGLQSVQEAVKGTEIATKTIRHVFETLKITPNDTLNRPNLSLGILVANQGGEYPISRGVDWEFGGPVVLDQFHIELSMCVQGVPVMTGTTPNWIWTATRNATADPALKSRSFSYMMTDGATPSYWKFLYGMATKLEVSAAENSPVVFSMAGFGRRLQADAAWTAGLSLPTIQTPAIPQSTVYIDAAWGTPTIPVAATVLAWKYTIETGIMPIDTADARADLDFTLDEINVSNVKTSVELLLLARASGGYDWKTEKTAAEAATLRQITILSAVDANRSLQFRGLMKYEAGSLFPDGEKDGLQTVNLKLVSGTDATNYMEMIVKNGVGTLT